MSSTTTVIEKELKQLRGLKFTLVLVAELEKLAANVDQVYEENTEPRMIRTTTYFRSETKSIVNPGDIAQKLNEANVKVMKRLDEFTNLGPAGALGVVRLQIWELYSIDHSVDGATSRHQPTSHHGRLST